MFWMRGGRCLIWKWQNLHHAAEFQRLLASLERMVGGRLPMATAEEKK